MKRLLALALLVSFLPISSHGYALPTLNLGSQETQDPAPTATPTPDVELEQAKREAALAEERKKKEVAEKEAAEARRAQLKAQTEAFGDPTKVSVPGGNVSTDQAGFVEVQMLSQEAAHDIVAQLSSSLCKRNIATLVIYNEGDMSALMLYRSMLKQLEKFKQDFDTKEKEFAKLYPKTDPKMVLPPSEKLLPPPPEMLLPPPPAGTSATGAADFGLGAIAIPGVATGIIKSAAELVNLFRSDTEFKNKDVTIPEDMVVSYLVGNFTDSDFTCSTRPAVYYPKLYAPDLFRDNADSQLLTVVIEISTKRATATENIGKISKRIQVINKLAGLIEQRNAKQEEQKQKEDEKKQVLVSDSRCRSKRCKKLTEEIALLKKSIDESNEEIAEQTGDENQTGKGEKAFLAIYKQWLTDLNKLKTLTQLLIDSADEITSKLNTPDDATKLTAMAQLLRAEQLAAILRQMGTFTLRVAVSANGTTKIKKNLFVDAKVRHSAGANLVYQLFDKDGKVVAANAAQHYFDYRSASDVRKEVAERNPLTPEQSNSGSTVASRRRP